MFIPAHEAPLMELDGIQRGGIHKMMAISVPQITKGAGQDIFIIGYSFNARR